MALLRTKQLAVNIKTAGGTPDAVIDNALRVTQDSSVTYDQGIENTQDDVATDSLTPAPTVTGTLGGAFAFNGNLESTDGIAQPSIHDALLICGMSSFEAQRLELDLVAGMEVGVGIVGVGSGAIGKIYGIREDLTEIQVVNEGVPFEAGDVITIDVTDYTVSAVKTEKAFVYVPDSFQYQDATVFLHRGDNVDAIKGVKGNITLSTNFGEFVKFALTGLGKTDTANRGAFAKPTANYDCDKAPGVFKGSEMKITWEGGEYIPKNTSASYNFGSQPVLLGDSVDPTGLYGAEITSRAEAGGSLTIYKPDYADFNAYDLKESDAKIKVHYWSGQGVTGRSVFIYQQAQMGQLTDGDENGTVSITMPLNSTGCSDDEQYILFM